MLVVGGAFVGVPRPGVRLLGNGRMRPAYCTATAARSDAMRFATIAERRYLGQSMPAELLRSLRDAGPPFGGNGNGIRVVTSEDVGPIKFRDTSVLLAQNYVPNDGLDLKLCITGEVRVR